ncbi:MAG: hypothetical protein M3Q69_05065 [Acidobacteriota bacterium]|nr:hypothetical protein [Acidobacteriota bacterium]
MTERAAAVAPHRATILVGFGAFGLDVLRRFLASTAPRGMLVWDDAPGGAAPSERHLRDLALLWVPDRAAREAGDVESAQEGNALEMMRDLYRQIQPLEGSDHLDDRFAKLLVETAETLLSASARATRTDALPLGLDVIVLARPTGREVIGTLDRLLVRGMETLANHGNLQRAVQGAQTLNFVGVYDFENYWDRSEGGRTIRRAVHGSVEQWQQRRTGGKPAFGRFYLVDSHTRDAVREPFVRVDEISLFLEFLLFEGQRGGELQRMYQPAGPFESAVSTFGIRLMERSTGLLGRLAAARFAIAWLEYLGGASPYIDADSSNLRDRLDEYEPQALDRLLEADTLRQGIDGGLATLESELTALPVEMPDWPQQVRQRYTAAAGELEAKLSKDAQSQMAKISGSSLGRLPDDLRNAIDADLRDARYPRTIGAVITEIETALEALDAPELPAAREDGAGELLNGMATLHADYARFHRERVHVEGLRRFWPLLALALAAGLTPVVHELLSDVPKPASLRFFADRAYALLQWINNPAALGLLLFTLLWLVGAAALHPRIAARIDRARRFYLDSDRGRFIDRIRSGLRPGGALRQEIDHRADRVLHEMTRSVRGIVSRELGRLLDRLRERRREMLWLREQLRGFLRIYGITSEDLKVEAGSLLRHGTGVRHAIERGEDVETMSSSNPAGPGRFRSVQASHGPFAGWSERYSRAFLAPLEFLEELSQLYQDPFQQELSRPGAGPEQQRLTREMRDFVTHRRPLELAFQFEAQEGVPPDRRYCLMPNLWRGLPGVLPALSDIGIGDAAVFRADRETGRAYLLRLQTGVEPKCLLLEGE